MCDWWFNVDCSLSESLYFLNIEIAEKNAERQRQREREREEAKEEEEEERQRKELTADEINDLRAGGEEKTREQPRRPNSLGGRPPVSSPQFSQTKSRPKNSRRPKVSKTTKAPRVANRFNGFGRLRKSKTSPSTATSGRVKTTINLRNSQTETKNPVRNNFAFGRQSVKSASENEGRKKKKKKSRLRKAKNQNNNSQSSSRFKTKPFTNFGNGQSRFGNF